MRNPILIAFLLLFLAAAILFSLELLTPSQGSSQISFVQRVIDGDTVVIADGSRIRLIGIDAPEKGAPCFEESKRALQKMVYGKAVELAFDDEKRDKYGRTLAYIFADGTFVNLSMVERGYALAFPFEPNLLHAEEFAAAEQLARSHGNGCLWETLK